MNIDQRIKQELEQENAKLDDILGKERGLFDMALTAYQGNLKGWIMVVTVITLAVTVALVWSGYQFFTAVDLQQQVFWGITFLFTLAMQVALKQWSWMEMNRTSILREVKRVEYSVAQLQRLVEERTD